MKNLIIVSFALFCAQTCVSQTLNFQTFGYKVVGCQIIDTSLLGNERYLDKHSGEMVIEDMSECGDSAYFPLRSIFDKIQSETQFFEDDNGLFWQLYSTEQPNGTLLWHYSEDGSKVPYKVINLRSEAKTFCTSYHYSKSGKVHFGQTNVTIKSNHIFVQNKNFTYRDRILDIIERVGFTEYQTDAATYFVKMDDTEILVVPITGKTLFLKL